jgi:SsrA-binding protein
MTKKTTQKVIATNRKASFDYEISTTYEAGLELTGTEVKSLRQGKASLSGGFVEIRNGEAWLLQIQINEYEFGNRQNHDPYRHRKLLLARTEIDKIEKSIERNGFTVVPIKLYFQGAWAKVEIAIAKGKKNYDKRQSEKEKSERRELREQQY